MSRNPSPQSLDEIIRVLIQYARSRGYNLVPNYFLNYSEDVLRREYEDLMHYGVNSWVTGVVGESVVNAHSKSHRRR